MAPPPPSPLIQGSSTPSAKPVAMTASTQSPPAARTSAPTSAALRDCAATIPPFETTAGFLICCRLENWSGMRASSLTFAGPCWRCGMSVACEAIPRRFWLLRFQGMPALWPLADQIDLDQRVVGKPGDADAGAGGAPIRWEILLVSLVHRRVVLLEARQINACHHNMFEAEVEAVQHDFKIFHHGLRLRDDALWQHARRCRRVRHLAGDEDEAVGLDGMAEGRDGLRPAGDHVKLHLSHPLLD